jgi:hypothetical protein
LTAVLLTAALGSNNCALAATELANRCLDAGNTQRINRVLDPTVCLDPSLDPSTDASFLDTPSDSPRGAKRTRAVAAGAGAALYARRNVRCPLPPPRGLPRLGATCDAARSAIEVLDHLLESTGGGGKFGARRFFDLHAYSRAEFPRLRIRAERKRESNQSPCLKTRAGF